MNKIYRHEDLKGIISKAWIIKNKEKKQPIKIKGKQIIIWITDMYNTYATYIDEKTQEAADGFFIEL